MKPAPSSCRSTRCRSLPAWKGKSPRFTSSCAQRPPANLRCSTSSARQRPLKPLCPVLAPYPAAERAANNQIVALAHSVAWGTSAIALLIGILGIANTMAMSVFERTREIGILRALGWKGRHVILLILAEATALGFVGGLLGIAVGWGGLRLLSALPQTASIVSASVSPFHLLESLVIAIASGLLAGAYPAWRGARLSPVEALRYE